jgi:hypothetical protein
MVFDEIAEVIGISKELVEYILHEEFDTKNFAQDWFCACSRQIKSALA